MEIGNMITICIAILALQLLLCFRVKKTVLKLVPAALLLIAEAVFVILMHTTSGWDAPVYAIFAIVFGIFLFACGTGWAVWFLVRFIQKKKDRS